VKANKKTPAPFSLRMRKRLKSLANLYRIDLRSARYHEDGNWYWPLEGFPGAYFDRNGCIIFQTEKEFIQCVYLRFGPKNVWVLGKHAGLGISDIPGYRKLEPPPQSL
jgi:hypothetical protein